MKNLISGFFIQNVTLLTVFIIVCVSISIFIVIRVSNIIHSNYVFLSFVKLKFYVFSEKSYAILVIEYTKTIWEKIWRDKSLFTWIDFIQDEKWDFYLIEVNAWPWVQTYIDSHLEWKWTTEEAYEEIYQKILDEILDKN